MLIGEGALIRMRAVNQTIVGFQCLVLSQIRVVACKILLRTDEGIHG